MGGAVVWGLLLLIGLCGLGAQLSRFAQGNALILVGWLIGWLIWRRKKPGRRKIVIGSVVALLVFATLIGAVSVRLGWSGEIRSRWSMFLHEEKPHAVERSLDFRMRPDSFIPSGAAGGSSGPREAAVRTCLRMMPEAGFLGLGPGSWSANFARFTDDPVLRTFYLHLQFAHNDWLQTVVEWGILGVLAWGVLVAGGLREAFRSLRRSKTSAEEIGAREAMVAGVAAALTGVLLHSLVDFPLQIPSIQIYFIVLLALAWNAAPNPESLATEHEL
jgi:O-antigen ligase